MQQSEFQPIGASRDRDRIELAIAALRDQRGELAEDDYARPEPLMVEIARLYDARRKAALGR